MKGTRIFLIRLLPVIFTVCFVLFPHSAFAALSIDGTAHGTTAGATTVSVTLTTSHANDVIIVFANGNGGAITGVTASGLTFTQRARSPSFPWMYEFYAIAASPLSSVSITTTQASSAFLTVDAFGISGANTVSLFDGSVVTGTIDPLSISTTNLNTMIIGGFRESGAQNPTQGSGYTRISGANFQLTEYKIVSGTQSGLSVSQNPGGGSNGDIADAVVQAPITYIGHHGLGKANIGHSNTIAVSNGLVGYWPFDGKQTNWATGVTNDFSGNNDNGQMIGMSTTTSPVPGKIGQALKFNGTSSYVSESTSIPGLRSVAFWAKTSSTTAQGIINLTGSTAYISTNASRVLSAPGFTSPTFYIDGVASSTPGLYDAKWHHVLVESTAALTGSQVEIGRANGALSSGTLDEVRMYNRALSYQEIQYLYMMGRVRI
jgi:hypothetical protein